MSGGIRTPGVEPHPDARRSRAEDELDRSLRPRRLEDFVGQEALKEQLGVSIEAAGGRGEALDHVLLAGPPGPRQDLARADRRRRARRRRSCRPPARRSSARATSPPSSPRSSRAASSSSTRSTACRARWRRPSIPRWRTASCRSPSAQGAGRARGHARPAALHADRRDHPRRAADHAAARPLRHPAPARALRARRPRPDRRPLRRASSASRSTPRGARAIAEPRARHPARRQPAAQARARLRRGARRRRTSTPTSPARRSTCSRSTTTGLDRLDREILARHLRRSSAAARSGSRRSPSPWARRRTRSRTSTSPTCCSAASSSARRAAAARPTRAFAHLGLEPPAEAAEPVLTLERP